MDKYYKVTPEPVYVRVSEDEMRNLTSEDLDTLIQDRANNMDANQIWKDQLSYRNCKVEVTTKKEANYNGWYEEESEEE